MNMDDMDICLLQEPPISFLHLTSVTPHWTVIYPTQHERNLGKTCVVTLISTRISSDTIHQIEVDSPDIIAVLTETEGGKLNVYNIYLDCKHSDALKPLTDMIELQCKQLP